MYDVLPECWSTNEIRVICSSTKLIPGSTDGLENGQSQVLQRSGAGLVHWLSDEAYQDECIRYQMRLSYMRRSLAMIAPARPAVGHLGHMSGSGAITDDCDSLAGHASLGELSLFRGIPELGHENQSSKGKRSRSSNTPYIAH